MLAVVTIVISMFLTGVSMLLAKMLRPAVFCHRGGLQGVASVLLHHCAWCELLQHFSFHLSFFLSSCYAMLVFCILCTGTRAMVRPGTRSLSTRVPWLPSISRCQLCHTQGTLQRAKPVESAAHRDLRVWDPPSPTV